MSTDAHSLARGDVTLLLQLRTPRGKVPFYRVVDARDTAVSLGFGETPREAMEAAAEAFELDGLEFPE